MIACSPVVLFVYNRVEHTEKTLLALKNNTLAKESELFIFSDGGKCDESHDAVSKVRKIISNVTGFKRVTVVEHTENIGLAKSIVKGVTDIVERYGTVIVLEDDLITSPFFLEYMNNALSQYRYCQDVWHISGWNYPIRNAGSGDSFFWHTMNCWGWATWDDRWCNFTKDPSYLIQTWDKKDIQSFNLDGAHNFWNQVERNATGEINTWAVFWYATIFAHNGLCLNPMHTLVKNIGYDGSGENCGDSDLYPGEVAKNLPKLSRELIVDVKTVNLIKQYYSSLKPNLLRRVLNKIKRILSEGSTCK